MVDDSGQLKRYRDARGLEANLACSHLVCPSRVNNGSPAWAWECPLLGVKQPHFRPTGGLLLAKRRHRCSKMGTFQTYPPHGHQLEYSYWGVNLNTTAGWFL